MPPGYCSRIALDSWLRRIVAAGTDLQSLFGPLEALIGDGLVSRGKAMKALLPARRHLESGVVEPLSPKPADALYLQQGCVASQAQESSSGPFSLRDKVGMREPKAVAFYSSLPGL
jgi:hypothetical protein